MRSGSRRRPVTQQGVSPLRRLVASRRPYVRSRRFCVHVAVELTEGDGISAISVTLELSHGIFRLPCRLPWQLRYLTAAKACEGDKIRALFVTLEPFRAIFRLPCIPSRHLRRRAATKQPEGDASGALSVALAPSRATFRRLHMLSRQQSSVRPHTYPPHDAKSEQESSTRLRTRYNTHMCPLSSAG